MTTESRLSETRRAICVVDVLARYGDTRPFNGAFLEVKIGASPAICDQDGVLGLIGVAGAIDNLLRKEMWRRLRRDGDTAGVMPHTLHRPDA
jgi:hypothetical protein